MTVDSEIRDFADIPVPPEDVVFLLQLPNGTTLSASLRNMLKQLDISEFAEDTQLVLDDARILFRTGAGQTRQAKLKDLLKKSIAEEIGDAAAGAVESLLSTSTTTMAIAVADGVHLFVEAGKSYRAGHPVFAAVTSDPTRKRMDGFVYSYSFDTGEMVVDWVRASGSGTYSSWNVCAVGAQGQDANKIYNGSGVPNSALGASGDFYIDITNSLLYGPKVGAAWGTGAPFASGPQGLQGPQGNVGPPDTTALDGLTQHRLFTLIGIPELDL